ncbi:MAG: response regulator [Proteiniphilum sp.]|jgi:signal transduction histidine kinase/ActR/RegA family two-component response regulator/HPt (histidine-containing phosphotransfer) domain-containing protein|nr:response regulator [Proteiniphilum sp.]
MESRKSPEQRVRIKIGLIFLVIILYFSGLFLYSHSLKRNMDAGKARMSNSYKVLSESNRLIISIQRVQEILNIYLASPQRGLKQQYDSISTDISRRIQDIKEMKPGKEQDVRLQEIDSLLQEKNRIVHRLKGLFNSRNPLTELDEKISSYDGIIPDSLASDADLKNITEEASRTYSSHIQGIEKEVQELLFAEQNISLHISQLTGDFYSETIRIAWRGTVNSEELSRRIFTFALVVGAFSILFILITILFIIADLNNGQRARTDLAREKQFTEELIVSRHKLLLSVSHDVKTPLSSIMGYMEMWDAEEKDADRKRQLQSARNSGRHILNMLTNLLEFSRLQQKSGTPHPCRFNLTALLEDLIRMFRPFTEEKALELTFDNRADSPLYMETDYTLLKQILTNIVSNAVKYTDCGGVVIALQCREESPVITVTDSGTGMDAGELPEIFQPFLRMKNPLKAEGSGLGMYVTKGLVDLLKGKIEIASEKGRGTCVTLTLPHGRASGQPPHLSADSHPAQKAAHYRKILIFEDDLPLGNMIREFLTRSGYRVKLCSRHLDVKGFLRIVTLFDIVFTDMQMTGITGMDILREIRKKDVRIPVWLMTAHGDYTRERACSEGFSGLIEKPVRMSALTDILATPKVPRDNPLPSGSEVPPEEEVVVVEEAAAEEVTNRFEREFPRFYAFFQGDEQAIREILSHFVRSVEKDMDALTAYIEEGNFEKAQQLSHRIHPFFGQLDADRLCTALHKMDRLREEGEPAYPDWKEKLTDTIAEIRLFADSIRENHLS